MMQGMRDYLKYVKRGYARTTHLTSIAIRKGELDRAEAENLVLEHEGVKPYSIQLFLEFLDISEEELNHILGSQVVDPWNGKVPVQIGKKPHDYDYWVSKLIG